MSTVNVALLYQTSQFETHLKDALRELGAAVVYEALAAEVDRDALEGSGASVVIVNLDPEVESHIDEVYDLLDDARYNVLFNDGTVSSGLQGWDQARWARHLAAKILGKPESVDPPRPAGSQAPRSPAQRFAETIPDMPAAAVQPIAAVPVAATPAAPSPFAGDNDLNNALDALLARADEPGAQSLRPVQADPGSVAPPPARVSPVADIARDLDQRADLSASSAKPVPPPPASVADTFDFAAELDSLVGDIPGSSLAPEPARASAPATPAAAPARDDFAFDLGDIGGADVPTAGIAPAAASADSDFGADLDALFADAAGTPPLAIMSSEFGIEATGADDLGATPPVAEFASDLPSGHDTPAFDDAADLPPLEGDFPALFEKFETDAAAEPAAPAKPAAVEKPAGGLGAFADWSLDPLEEPAEDGTPPPAAAKPAAPKPAADAFGVKVQKAEDFLAGKDWGLEAIEEEDAEGATPAKPALPEVKVEKMAAQEFLAPEGGDADKFQFNADIGLDLMPMEEAVAPEDFAAAPAASAPARAAPVIGAPGGQVKRAIVLGASIGGPEAVREYLAALPPRFPALFLLAQHMGQEFLELMSAQLAKVTQLIVRNPTHGERVGHGEVIVVPTDKRLMVDGDGVVQLRPLMESSPYSPSIDLVIKDIADKFGANATAIIFSGMAHDAIEGSKYLAAKGGTVWVQDPDTCVISSMVDGANEAGVVSYSAAPLQLAQQTVSVYGKG